jgi:hypothetical protein
MSNEVRVKAGEKPPETVEHEGKTYRPNWIDVTTDADRRRGEAAFLIQAMGQPLESGKE